jgi:membrane-associated phospholipid phosphatase
MRRAAVIISYIFHPLWMPLLVFGLAMWVDPYLIAQRAVVPFIAIVLSVNVLAPGASIWIMVKRGMVSSKEIPGRKERLGPFIVVATYYFITYWFLRPRTMILSEPLVAMFCAVWVALVLTILINLKWKISVHMLAQGGMIGCLAALSKLHFLNIGPLLIFLILIAGWVGFSRLYLQAHTHAQVYAGFLLGFVVNYTIVGYGLFV